MCRPVALAVVGRHARAEQRDLLATADQQERQREAEHRGARLLVWPPFFGDKAHRRRAVAPDPHALGRLPLVLAHEGGARFGGLAPVDVLGRIAGPVLSELPEAVALAHPAAAVHALDDGRGDPFGSNHEVGNERGRFLGGTAQRRCALCRGFRAAAVGLAQVRA